ncbi:MAG: SUF system NifU family Fe-S cluster assembly protein [Cyclobacteriaceae bacterium]
MDKIKQLYQTVILEEAKNPYHEGDFPEANVTLSAYNPTCGDKFSIHLKVINGQVEDAWFTGFGCSISKASTSIMCRKLEGKSVADLDRLVVVFREIIDPNGGVIEVDDQLSAFKGARYFPERRSCAELSWLELEKWINESLTI